MKWILSVLLLAGVACASAERPNIVFIFSDDHAVQAMGAYPSWLHDFIEKQQVTPNIDRLAKDGVVFANSFCGNSICSPSRAAILTGKHSHLNGVTKWETFDGRQTTFPKLLQKAGYQTAIIGKWHLTSEPTGFNHWEVLPGQGDYYNPDFLTAKGTVRYEGYCTDIITDRALLWLEQRRAKDKPFMIMIQHKAPHRTWMPGPKYLTWLDDVTVPEPPTLLDDYQGRTKSVSQHQMGIRDHLRLSYDLKVDPPESAWPKDQNGTPKKPSSYRRLNPEQAAAWRAAYQPRYDDFQKRHPTGDALTRWNYQAYMKDYLRCVKSLDDNIGRVRDYLKNAGLDKNTIVIYSSDQGFYLGEHGWYDKRWMYEESFRMPLIVNWPDVTKPGTRVNELVQNIDYAPTFLQMAGLPVPAEMQGISLVPLLKGETPKDWRTDLYYHYYDGPGEHGVAVHEGVRTARYKLIHFYRAGDWELFDLEKDPQELRSVANDPAYAKVLAEMKQRLAAARKFYKLPPLQFREEKATAATQ
jgi:arylsulfatase A-like enzyme